MSLPFEREQYRTEVLDPMRKDTQDLPGDLLARYAVPVSTELGAVEFTEHIEMVEGYWRALGQQQKHRYQQLVDSLLVAHQQMRDRRELSLAFFVEQSRAHRAEALTKLENRIRALAPPVSRPEVDRIVASLPIRPTAGELTEILTRLDVGLIEPWPLPDPASVPQLGDLVKALRVLGLPLAAEAVVGTEVVRAGFRIRHGFRLVSGDAVLTGPQIEEARQQLDAKQQDQRQTAASTALSIMLTAAARPPALDHLLLLQLVDRLKPLSRLPVQTIVAEAADLGLDRIEALGLAVTLADRIEDPAEATRREIHAALGRGELREAQRLSAFLPAKDELRRQVAELDESVDRLGKEADDARRQGREEEAAELFTQAIRIAGDDEMLGRSLQQLAPAGPTGLRARVDGDRVLLNWDQPRGFTEGLTHLVVRMPVAVADTDQPQNWPKVAQTHDHSATDAEPPLGEKLTYVVLATRGRAWSEGVAVTVPMVAPEVTDFRAVSRDLVVFGSWRPHPRAHGVVVLRAEGAPPPASSASRMVPATPVDFQDGEVRSSRRYYYRVRSVYQTRTGEEVLTAGVLADIMPSAMPTVVDDLVIDLTAGPAGPVGAAVRLSWTQPSEGRVELRRRTTPPSAETGTELAVTELPTVGQALVGRVLAVKDGRAGFVADLPSGRSWITAVTIAGDLAVIGGTQELKMISPVRNLRARRVGARIAVSWIWPERVEVCRVEWEGTTMDCGRRRFVDDGGLTIDAGPGPVQIAVSSVSRDETSETVAPSVSVIASTATAEIHYTVRRGRIFGRRRAVVTFRCERSAQLPALTVVHSGTSVRPLRRDQGRPVGRVREQDVGPTRPVSLTVAVPRGFGPCWLLAFPDDRDREDVVLVHAGRG